MTYHLGLAVLPQNYYWPVCYTLCNDYVTMSIVIPDEFARERALIGQRACMFVMQKLQTISSVRRQPTPLLSHPLRSLMLPYGCPFQKTRVPSHESHPPAYTSQLAVILRLCSDKRRSSYLPVTVKDFAYSGGLGTLVEELLF
jgi:hypothetical protein